MSQWEKDTDIRVFVQTVYTDAPSFGSELCASHEKDMREQARAFTKMLMEVPHSSNYLDFYQDAQFGQVAKYAIALKCCTHRLLEDAGFYSLAHVLEAESDLDCSLLLASNFYYKQATLMLRSILEEVLLPIHFCDSVSDFDNWKANNYRTPNLRGRDGLIQRLLKKNIIHEPLATQTAVLYGNLSAYVHGSQSTLIHQNIHLGEVHRVEFNQGICPVSGILDRERRERRHSGKSEESDEPEKAVYARVQGQSGARKLPTGTTIEAVRKKFGVSNSMIHRWRQEFQSNLTLLFSDKRDPKMKAQAQGYRPGESPDDLKKIIGELTVQNEILKKVQGLLGH